MSYTMKKRKEERQRFIDRSHVVLWLEPFGRTDTKCAQNAIIGRTRQRNIAPASPRRNNKCVRRNVSKIMSANSQKNEWVIRVQRERFVFFVTIVRQVVQYLRTQKTCNVYPDTERNTRVRLWFVEICCRTCISRDLYTITGSLFFFNCTVLAPRKDTGTRQCL